MARQKGIDYGARPVPTETDILNVAGGEKPVLHNEGWDRRKPFLSAAHYGIQELCFRHAEPRFSNRLYKILDFNEFMGLAFKFHKEREHGLSNNLQQYLRDLKTPDVLRVLTEEGLSMIASLNNKSEAVTRVNEALNPFTPVPPLNDRYKWLETNHGDFLASINKYLLTVPVPKVITCVSVPSDPDDIATLIQRKFTNMPTDYIKPWELIPKERLGPQYEN